MSYRIASRSPLELEECTHGSGASCGSIRLDEQFVRLVRRKLGEHASQVLTPRRLHELRRHFEQLKRNFNPYEDRDGDPLQIEIPLVGVCDIPSCGVDAGYLVLERLRPRSS
jgi:hypothetical protein